MDIHVRISMYGSPYRDTHIWIFIDGYAYMYSLPLMTLTRLGDTRPMDADGGDGVGADVGAHVSATSDKSSIPQLSAMLFWCSHDSVDRVNMYLMSTLLVLTFQAERSCENVVP